MTPPPPRRPAAGGPQPGDPALAARLGAAMRGEVRFDALTRGIYATDASHYQIEPLGVVFPRTVADVEAALGVARDVGVPVLPRGAGTSQCGQIVGRAVVLDVSRHLTGIGPTVGNDAHRPTIEVEPGVVLDHLNRVLAPSGLWFPVDPSTGSRATLGGMAGNNSAGARSLRYGMMVDNVAAVEVLLADGRRAWIGEGEDVGAGSGPLAAELAALDRIHADNAEEIRLRTPRTLRNVAGYNLDRLGGARANPAGVLVGSEGTLGVFTRLRLQLAPLPRRRVLGVAHFPDLYGALDAVQRVVELGPSAVELVDENVLRLASERPEFRTTMARFVRGSPGALLLVEFDADSGRDDPAERLDDLSSLLGDLGFPGAVVPVIEPAAQAALWSVRKAGLNIVMSMAGPRKPISFVEDCAVPLPRLAEYARRVDAVFAGHGCTGTWYAHASVGCLHVRPALNLKDPDDVTRMRRIAEGVHEVVRDLEGTHSGEHGDGILRSEFLEGMLGKAMVDAYRRVKDVFDPRGLMNPGKIVDAPRMDDRSLFRYPPDYDAERATRALPVVLDWSREGGILQAAERCNNNGACRKSDPGVMCPSYRVSGDERHSTRGRANALRLALTGQLGSDGLDSPEMDEAMSLCISCKGCRRECPTGVDMARLKLEWLNHRNERSGVAWRDRLMAELPRRAPLLSRAARLARRLGLGGVAGAATGRVLGFSPERRLPDWSSEPWRDGSSEPWGDRGVAGGTPGDPPVVLFVDTFTRWFEPDHARDALAVLRAGGHRVLSPGPDRTRNGDSSRPLCCGRTYLSAGMLSAARAEMERTVAALAPMVREGSSIVGLEPSCVFTLVDELPGMSPTAEARAVADATMLVETFLDRAWNAGRTLPLGPLRPTGAPDSDVPPAPGVDTTTALLHGHCHQKAFDATGATLRMLERIPGMDVSEIRSGCCGMAGGFGYQAGNYRTSMAMGELDVFPAVRGAPTHASIVADGTSCRAQIADGVGREAVHAITLLRRALKDRGISP